MAGRTFLVTGASRGIGRALAELLARTGNEVVGLARRPDPGFPGRLVSVDLADATATREALTAVAREHRLSGVVNNVGVVRPQRLAEIGTADLAAVLDLNLRPALQATQAALPAMREAGWGRVVNVASLVVLGVVERTAYAAAKAGLVSFTRSWALELATTGVTVNAVGPGPTETELFRANNPPGSPGEARYLDGVPMRRFGQPEEIAAAIGFFLGDEAGFVTGQTLYVDGGASLGKALF